PPPPRSTLFPYTTLFRSSALLAARQLREKILALAGHLLEADPADLDLIDGQIAVRGDSTRRLDLATVAFEATIAQNLPSGMEPGDRKSTRLNSSHSQISY